MLGDFKMLRTALVLSSVCAIVHGSGAHHVGAPIANAPVVTASSSQYFERTFNRLVAAPPVVPVAPAPPVYIQTAQALPVPVPQPQAIPFQPVQPVQPVQHLQPVQPIQPPQPVEPNVAIAIATANAAAPVATILLPPYPFGFPPGFGFIPQPQPSNVDEQTKDPEQTTTKTTTQVEIKTTSREPEATTPLPAGSDNNFVQALPSNPEVSFKQYLAPAPPQPQPSNQNVNFRQYLAPAQPQQPQQSWPQQPQPSSQNVNFKQYLAPAQSLPIALPEPHHHHHHHHHQPHAHIHVYGKPQKLKTAVEIVKVPLAYIAPPPIPQYPHNHEAIKVVKHIHSFVPTRAKLIIRPVSHLNTRSAPVKVIEYKAPYSARNVAPRLQAAGSQNSRDIEFTTFRPFPRPNTKPPRL